MNRVVPALPVASLVFAAVLLLSAATIGSGLLSDDAIRLWAGATAAGEGQVSIGRIVAAYPTIPFLSSVAVAFIAPAGTPAPALVAAGLFGIITGAWFLAFREAGLRVLVALAATLLLASHPALLRAAVAGPAEMFFAIFLYLFGRGLYDLRALGTASAVMTVGLALLGLAFSHPLGAAVAIASVPFLAFAVRPALIARSATNVVITLIFPAVFAAGAFLYVSWVFPGSGWSFLAAPAESFSVWSAGVERLLGQNFSRLLAAYAALAIGCSLVLGAPIAAMALAQMWRRRPLVMPALVFGGSTMVAAAATVTTGLLGDPSPLAVAAPVLAAVVVIHVPIARERPAAGLSLMALGWVGGVVSLALADPAAVAQVRAQWERGVSTTSERAGALAFGGATAGREGILIDTENAPAIVVGRGAARGILSPASEAFALALLFARLDAPFVAVPDPHGVSGGQDRLNRAFPSLYRAAAPGYRLVYENQGWRLFARSEATAIDNK